MLSRDNVASALRSIFAENFRETLRDRNAVYRVVGVLSDPRSRVGREIYGVPVLGTIDELEAVVARLDRRGNRPQKLIVTPQGLEGTAIRGLFERADALAIPLARLPRATELRQEHADVERIEPIAIEPGESARDRTAPHP